MVRHVWLRTWKEGERRWEDESVGGQRWVAKVRERTTLYLWSFGCVKMFLLGVRWVDLRDKDNKY